MYLMAVYLLASSLYCFWTSLLIPDFILIHVLNEPKNSESTLTNFLLSMAVTQATHRKVQFPPLQTYWPMGRVLPLWSKPPGPQILLSIISVPTFPLSPTNKLFFISCLEPSSYGKVPPLQRGDVGG